MRSFPDLTDVGFSSRTIEPVGTGSSRVMLLGEAPGEFEDRFYSPFYGLAPAGALLSRMLRRAGLGGWNDVDGWKSSQFRILNVVWQRPPRNWLESSPWETRAIEAWRPFVEEEIKRMNPRVIVALGGTALRFLTSYGGEGTGVTQVARYVLRSNYDAWCLPLEHPSFLLPRGAEEDQKGQANNMRLMGAGIFGLQRAVTIAREGFEREVPRYITHPNLDEMLAFERDYNPERHTLSYDIETPRSSHLDEEDREEEDPSYEIIRASMCYETARAISFPWCHPYTDIARRLLASGGPKRVWNSPFDNPRLRANACEIGGRNYDVMEQWSHLQRTLPRGLGFVAPFYGWTLDPWKHESDANPEYYSCCDADALHRIGEGTMEDLKATGQWERYERHVVDTYEVLTFMSRNGLPYSQEEAAKFQEELEKLQLERLELLQARVPESVRPSKQKQGLKREPINTNGYVRRQFKVLARDLTEEERAPFLNAYDHDIVNVWRWCLVEPFLPTSSKQVLDLIKHFGHTPGTNRKSKKETSDEDTLRKLLKKYKTARKESDRDAAELYKLILECRQLSKVLGTYVKGWKPGKDGRIHSTPGFWGKMFRISWRRPNIAATIADKEEEYIAAGFRKCVRAPEGKVLLESDWKGIEAVLVGWFAGDESYMRLARLGVHDYMCCHLLVDRHKMAASDLPSLAWSDGDLKALFKDVKKRFPKDRDDAKHTVHGCVTGDHEVLTEYGWVPFTDYDGSPVATWDAGRITFEKPSHITHHPWSGVMVKLSGRALSTLMTPDHVLPVASNEANPYRRVPAESLPQSGRVPVSGVYDATRATKSSTIRLAVAIQADAALYGTNAVFHVVRPRKCAQLDALLNGEFEYTKELCGCHSDGWRYRVKVPRDVFHLLTYEKTFSSTILHLTPLGRRLFLDEITKWDGHESNDKRNRREYLTTDRNAAVLVQTLAHLNGQEALLRSRKASSGHMGKKRVYCVSFNKRMQTRLECVKRQDVLFVGDVYCVTVPSGYFLVRHRDRIFVTGNTNYGMTWKLLSELYGLTASDAKKLIALYFSLFPKVKEWQQNTLQRAYQEGRLTNPFGYSMWFWDVLKWNSRYQRMELGTDAKSAISFLPRDTAAAMLKEALLRLDAPPYELASRGIMLSSTHDSILTEQLESQVDTVARVVKEEMERPVPELGGLVIGVEQKVGHTWDSEGMKTLQAQEVLV